MPKTHQQNTGTSGNRAVMIWLFAFACSVAFLVLWGGYTRLTRSGLSIVEWNPVSGAIPPLGAQAWQEEFSKYQQTPEFQQVNSGMTLEEYQFIFYIEWIHRVLARAIGLIYAIPFLYFLFTKKIPWRAAGRYVAIGLLYISQAFAGWFMVASGLDERPSVSHYLLTFHLLLALALFGLSLWTAFDLRYGFPPGGKAHFSLPFKLAAATLILLLLQIAYGGLTAGLKAGHVSDTWPLMSGRLVPPGLLTALEPWTLSLVEAPQTVAFIHRWLAFAVLGMAVALYLTARGPGVPRDAQNASFLLMGLVAAQVLLGIGVVIFHVKIELALLHQALAIGLLACNLLALHRLRAEASTR
jgi:cytochrome c oxidase assembly protein subunit 15